MEKSIKSMFHSPRIRFQANPSSVVVTIVFRGKGDFDGFLTKFWECWRGRAWEEEEKSESETSRSGSGPVAQGLYGNDGTVRMVGLAGILRKEQEQWESTNKSFHDAFQNLNALMVADVVRIPLEQAGGMISLTDIYYHFNRARGTVMLRKFDSGVMVIQNKSHSDDEVMSRIRMLVTKPKTLRTGVSASDAALTLKIAPAMAKEHILTVETKGLLCRDMSPDGLRFYFNLFPEFDPTNLHMLVE